MLTLQKLLVFDELAERHHQTLEATFKKYSNQYIQQIQQEIKIWKGDNVVAITESEKNAISEKYPHTHFVRTMRNDSKRHHYYCEETKGIMALLNKMRGNEE